MKKLMGEMLAALTYIHKKNIVHLDIKPENVLVDKSSDQPSVKLIDFGLSQWLVKGSATLENACGTIDFKAPEVLP